MAKPIARTRPMTTPCTPVSVSIRGISIAVIGGELREPARQRLQRALGCNVTHFESRENDASPQRFARFASLQFDLIIWIFGRSRHAHGDFVRQMSRKLGTPFLTLKSFPHPNRLLAALRDRHLTSCMVGGAR